MTSDPVPEQLDQYSAKTEPAGDNISRENQKIYFLFCAFFLGHPKV